MAEARQQALCEVQGWGLEHQPTRKNAHAFLDLGVLVVDAVVLVVGADPLGHLGAAPRQVKWSCSSMSR
jgi:hypothetical protein